MTPNDAIYLLSDLRKRLNEYCGLNDNGQKAFDMAISALEKLDSVASAQPEQRWIPCSERLLEKPNMYTVTDSKGNVVRFVFCDTESSREYWLRCVKAWMPLPEPYKEGDSDDQH